MSAAPPKYIFENGVMKMNPAFNAQAGRPAPPATIHQPLAVVTCLADAQSYAGTAEQEFYMAPSATAAIEEMQSPAYQAYFEVSEGKLFDELSTYFAQYEVPMGLLSKLLLLRKYRINIMVDDSGSMMSSTDVTFAEATNYLRGEHDPRSNLTRIQEAENRLHIMFDMLSYIPTKGITMTFMTTPKVLTFEQAGKSPQQFQAEAHATISDTFANLKMGVTPTKKILQDSLRDAAAHSEHPTSHYLLTDGVPSDVSVSELARIINKRENPERNPLTLISCTNVDSECEWMKEVEEKAAFCSEVDDYGDESREVKKDQGDAFPYTKGLWLLSNLVGAISPDDLDALDENVPLTKFTLDELMGRVHSSAEYDYYFAHNKHGRKYLHLKGRFATEQVHASAIVPKNKRGKGGCIMM